MKVSSSSRSVGLLAALAAAVVASSAAWSGSIRPNARALADQRAQHPAIQAATTELRQQLTPASPDLKVYGRSYGEWAAQWVAWSEAGPAGANAITDQTGEFCADNQPPGAVWFLAGTFGGHAERSCTIPRGRALFYPIAEAPWIDCPGTDEHLLTDDQVRDILASFLSSPWEITSALNDVPIVSLLAMIVRTQTPVFTNVLPADNVLNAIQLCAQPLAGGRTGRRIGDGYWVMLSPLPPGEHTLTLRGALGGFETSVKYNLTVK